MFGTKVLVPLNPGVGASNRWSAWDSFTIRALFCLWVRLMHATGSFFGHCDEFLEPRFLGIFDFIHDDGVGLVVEIPV